MKVKGEISHPTLAEHIFVDRRLLFSHMKTGDRQAPDRAQAKSKQNRAKKQYILLYSREDCRYLRLPLSLFPSQVDSNK